LGGKRTLKGVRAKTNPKSAEIPRKEYELAGAVKNEIPLRSRGV